LHLKILLYPTLPITSYHSKLAILALFYRYQILLFSFL
jgi:hypothetical protein